MDAVVYNHLFYAIGPFGVCNSDRNTPTKNKTQKTIQEFHPLNFFGLKGSRSHLQISLNITKLCKDEKYTVVMMYMKSYSCRLYNVQIRDTNLN